MISDHDVSEMKFWADRMFPNQVVVEQRTVSQSSGGVKSDPGYTEIAGSPFDCRVSFDTDLEQVSDIADQEQQQAMAIVAMPAGTDVDIEEEIRFTVTIGGETLHLEPIGVNAPTTYEVQRKYKCRVI